MESECGTAFIIEIAELRIASPIDYSGRLLVFVLVIVFIVFFLFLLARLCFGTDGDVHCTGQTERSGG